MKLILILALILNFAYISASHDFEAYLKDLVDAEVDERLDSKEHRKNEDSPKNSLDKLEDLDSLDILPQEKTAESDDSDISEKEILDKLDKEDGEKENDDKDDDEESLEQLLNVVENDDDDDDDLQLEDEEDMRDVQSDPAWRRRRRGGLSGWWNKIKAQWNKLPKWLKDWLKKHSLAWIKKCCAQNKNVCVKRPVVKSAACLYLKLKKIG